MSGFERYQHARNTLLDVMTRLEAAHRELGITARADTLALARTRLTNDSFRLMVVGEFKRGKSTFINALLGQSVLPAQVSPCTAVITEVHYAETSRAVLHPVDPNEAPLTVPLEELRRHVVIEEEDEDDAAPPQPPRWSKVEVYTPIELCKNDVVVTDSPGLNEHRARTDVAMNYLPHADAMIMVLSCDQALAQSELAFIEQHLGERADNVFFLWNRFDHVADAPEDLERILARSRKHLGARVRHDERVYFVSARQALEARKKNDPALLAQSRFPAFEGALVKFLVDERGRVKVLAPLQASEAALRDVALQLPRMDATLAQPLEALRTKYERVQPRIAELETRRERIHQLFARRHAALQRAVGSAIQVFAVQLEGRLEKSSHDVSATWWDGVVSRRGTHKKIVEWLSGEVSAGVTAFEKETLAPLVAQHMTELSADLDDQLRSFLADIDLIRNDFTGGFAAGNLTEDDGDAHPLNRVLAAAGALFLVPAGLAGIVIDGAAGGVQGILQGLAYQVTALVGVLILAVAFPPAAAVILPIAIAASLGTAIARAVVGGKSAVEEVRERAVRDVTEALRANLPTMSASVEEKIGAKMNEFSGAVERGIGVLSEQVRQEVESVWLEKQAGEQAVAERRAKLRQAEATLAGLAKELDQLRGTL